MNSFSTSLEKAFPRSFPWVVRQVLAIALLALQVPRVFCGIEIFR
jgi:hypothetical protein